MLLLAGLSGVYSDPIGSVYRNFVDLDPYSQYVSGSTHVNILNI